MLHAWDSKGKKLTTKVTVTHEVRRNEVDSIAPAQTELTPALPVLVFPQSSKGLKRRKRDWIIPPINFPENDRGPFPKHMVQIRSSRDKELQLQYSITGPGADLDPKELFIIDRMTGWLSVTQPLDREGKDKYKLFAHAVAVGYGKAEDPMEIVINVIDRNDNKPEFTKDTFLGSVPESSPKGFEFMKVTAVDKDEPGSAYSDIRYTLVSQDPQQPSPNMFVLNPLTGGLRLNSELDRENYPKYTLKIEATDMGDVGLTSVCTVIITVTDTNDPQFQKYMHIASVPENKVGAEVVKMLLTGDPHGSAKLPIYKIIDGNDEGFFKVHTGSKREGIITTAKGLDFEKKSQHILSVSVVTNDNYQTSKARVILNVEDVNEAPLFNPAELVVVEPESVTAGSDLALYPAIDPDTASNQSIRYMACVDPSGWLDVNKENGLIKLKSAINRESPCVQGGKYKALILAIDDGEVPKTGTGTLVIELQGSYCWRKTREDLSIMLGGGFKAERLRVNLRLVINRLKLLEKKKTELAQKSRKEIADYLSSGKDERARIRVEHIIREDYLVEAMEILELYCDLLLARFGLIQSMKELDPGLQEAVSTLIWAAPRLQSEVSELKIVSDQLCAKYSKEYGKLCRTNQIGTVNDRLMLKLSVEAPPKILVERYLIEIAKNYNVPYEPDAMVRPEACVGEAADLIDVDNNSRKPGGGGGGGGGGFTAPPATVPMPIGFNYPPTKGAEPFNGPVGTYDGFSHFQPPVGGGQPPQLPSCPPTYESIDELAVKPSVPTQVFGPGPSSQASNNTGLPELPSVPDTLPASSFGGASAPSDDIDFDDLSRRFEELKKKT
ncbi:hypothetical protein AGOR_G00167750 [Albula goreensis]|uniref:IST1 homolog n=1 Tax=Albula goreensis TaxID=1534307 RepID=A0A8T3D2P1_9TELE|nr:hypothetical protein AGOR_G00167750 [Albula goreensis]